MEVRAAPARCARRARRGASAGWAGGARQRRQRRAPDGRGAAPRTCGGAGRGGRPRWGTGSAGSAPCGRPRGGAGSCRSARAASTPPWRAPLRRPAACRGRSGMDEVLLAGQSAGTPANGHACIKLLCCWPCGKWQLRMYELRWNNRTYKIGTGWWTTGRYDECCRLCEDSMRVSRDKTITPSPPRAPSWRPPLSRRPRSGRCCSPPLQWQCSSLQARHRAHIKHRKKAQPWLPTLSSARVLGPRTNFDYACEVRLEGGRRMFTRCSGTDTCKS